MTLRLVPKTCAERQWNPRPSWGSPVPGATPHPSRSERPVLSSTQGHGPTRPVQPVLTGGARPGGQLGGPAVHRSPGLLSTALPLAAVATIHPVSTPRTLPSKCGQHGPPSVLPDPRRLPRDRRVHPTVSRLAEPDRAWPSLARPSAPAGLPEGFRKATSCGQLQNKGMGQQFLDDLTSHMFNCKRRGPGDFHVGLSSLAQGRSPVSSRVAVSHAPGAQAQETQR